MPHFKSIALWPDYLSVGSSTEVNESVDIHDTPEQAYAVCRMLNRKGFGGMGKVFPLSTRVEEIEG